MSTSMLAGCPDVVIGIGTASSNTVLSSLVFEDAESIVLYCAGIDGAQTYKIQISNDGGTAWSDWTDGTSVIIPPSTINTASVYPNPVFSAFKVLANGNVASTCTWKMQKRFTTGGY